MGRHFSDNHTMRWDVFTYTRGLAIRARRQPVAQPVQAFAAAKTGRKTYIQGEPKNWTVF